MRYFYDQQKRKTIEKQLRRLREGKKKARRDAALILGSIGDDLVCSHLERALNRDKDSNVRCNAVWALGAIGNKGSVDDIIDALDDPDEEFLYHALLALSRFDDKDATRAIVNALRIEGYESLIEDILLNCKLRKKIDLLIDELRNNENAKVRREIATILGKLQVKKAVRALIQALNDNDVYVRIEAVKALAEFKDKRAIPGLAVRLNDDISDVRNSARKALTTIVKAEDPMTELI